MSTEPERPVDGTACRHVKFFLYTPTTTANIPRNVILASPIDTDVKLDATIVYSNGRLQNMDSMLNVNSGKTMRFRALGGRGGDGGILMNLLESTLPEDLWIESHKSVDSCRLYLLHILIT